MTGRLFGAPAAGVGKVSFDFARVLSEANSIAAFVFNADPLQAKICHCEDCQRLHGESIAAESDAFELIVRCSLPARGCLQEGYDQVGLRS